MPDPGPVMVLADVTKVSLPMSSGRTCSGEESSALRDDECPPRGGEPCLPSPAAREAPPTANEVKSLALTE